MRIQLLLLNIENVFITRKLIDIKQTIQENSQVPVGIFKADQEKSIDIYDRSRDIDIIKASARVY